MKKQILFTMLLAMFAVASWGQEGTTEKIVCSKIVMSTNVENPEAVFTLKNGRYRRMIPTTGPTETLANVGLFAFFGVPEDDPFGTAPDEFSFKIYSVTAKKWLSYKPESAYANCLNFVQLVDNRDEAEWWHVTSMGAYASFDECYVIRPFTSMGAISCYMNWYGSKSSYPNDDKSMTAGLTVNSNEDPLGAYWILRLVHSTKSEYEGDVDKTFVTDVIKETTAWGKSIETGTGFGEYSLDDEAEWGAVLAQVQKASNAYEVLEKAQQYRSMPRINGMTGGGVYRFINVGNGSYWGMRGADCKQYGVLKSDDIDQNPMVLWKYETRDDGNYLRNFYSGLYSQEIDVTPNAAMATGLINKTTVPVKISLVEGATKTSLPKVSVYLGDVKVAAVKKEGVAEEEEIRIWADKNGNDEGYFYVQQVDEEETVLDQRCVSYYNTHGGSKNIPEEYIYKKKEDGTIEELLPKLPEKAEGVAVMLHTLSISFPIELINQYIDAVSIIGDVTHEKIIEKYDAICVGQEDMIQYKTALGSKGKPLKDVVLYDVPNAEYATICVPAAWKTIQGVRRFVCNKINSETAQFDLVEQQNAIKPGIPFLIEISEEHRGTKWQFIKFENDNLGFVKYEGDNVLVDQESHNWLKGILKCNDQLIDGGVVIKEGYRVPDGEGNYVLARKRIPGGGYGKIGFSLVTQGADKVYLDQYKCFLRDEAGTIAGSRQSFLSIALSDVETGIDDVLDITQDDVLDENQDNGKIYNMSGQRLNRMQKGLNIVNGKIVIKN